MKTLLPDNPSLPYFKNNGMTLTVNGLRKLINKDFMNSSLETARDLWILSFILMGLDIREILTAKKDEVMEGIFLAHKNKDDTIPLPLYDIGYDIFQKYTGKIYALKVIEETGIPGRIEGQRKATRMRYDFNRRMEMITKAMQFDCLLPFENTRLIWMLLAKDMKVDDRAIGLMGDFTTNISNRKLMGGKLELVANANNKLMDLVYGIEEETNEKKEQYPKVLEDGSVLLYES